MKDASAKVYSQYLYNKYSKSPIYSLSRQPIDLFSLIGPDDCEDIVGLYLQEEKGYRIIPSSCKSDTAKYEFVLRHKDTGHKAVVQVKQGKADLEIEEFSRLSDDCVVYLFTSHGNYIGIQQENVHCLDRRTLSEFVTSKRCILSQRLNTWLSLSEELIGQ
ncbi:MAG: hypothetical protein R8K46_08490 [Mariprofundaceae bacterium]